MRFGKISAGLLISAGAIIMLMIILKPGWGDPLGALGGCSIMLLVPASLVLGILGICLDQKKRLAIFVTALTGSLILFYFTMMLANMLAVF